MLDVALDQVTKTTWYDHLHVWVAVPVRKATAGKGRGAPHPTSVKNLWGLPTCGKPITQKILPIASTASAPDRVQCRTAPLAIVDVEKRLARGWLGRGQHTVPGRALGSTPRWFSGSPSAFLTQGEGTRRPT